MTMVKYENGPRTTVQYTPAVAVLAGDVIVVGDQCMVSDTDNPPGTGLPIRQQSLNCGGGIYSGPADGTIAVGKYVYWDPIASKFTSTVTANTPFGWLVAGPLGRADDGGPVSSGDKCYVLHGSTKNVALAAGSITADDITGSDTSLAITGKAGATSAGGDVPIAGGAGNGTTNVGGVASLTGGVGAVTGAGGVAKIVGGAGGATSGTGGAAQVTGGAGINGNAVGGAAVITGGAGQGSAAGGAVTIVSGAAGATGVAGAINITVGGATAGAGSAVTITGGAGAASTNAGGNVNLVGGAAVSTGIPGEVQVNANSNLIYVQIPLTATDVSRAVFICTRPVRLKTVSFMHTTGSTSGTLTVEKLTGTTAAGSGTALLSGTIDLSTGTVANTTTNGTVIATVASKTFATGDRVSIVIAGTMTSLAGGIVTIGLAPC